jgi:hypothetical protein
MKKITLMAVMLLFSALSFAQVNLANGLIAYYPYNGNADDASGNGFNGTVGSGVSLTADRFGNANKAYSFNSNTITSNLQQDPYSDFTLNFWFKTNGNDNDVPFSWVNNGSSYTNLVFKINSNDSKAKVQFEEFDNIASCYDLYTSGNSSNGTVYSDNEWHMVTINNQSDRLYLYIDTILVDSDSMLDNCPDLSFSLLELVAGNSSTLFGYTGSIDDIMAYNRVLNASERAYLYNLTSAWSTPTATELISENNINIYPNPVDNLANISFPENGIYNIQVVDMTGRLIYTAQVSDQNLQLNTSSWAAGMYRLNIFNENGQFESKTIVKE